MGFTKVSHQFTMNREKFVSLIIYGKAVTCTMQNGDKVVISNVSNHRINDLDHYGRPQRHDFLASVEFEGRTFGQAKLTLTTTNSWRYSGTVEYEQYPDDNLSE